MPPRASNKPRTPIALPEADEAFLRQEEVLRLFPVGATTWWKGIAEGRYPRPVKLSTRITAWRVKDIRQLLASVAAEPAK